MLWIYIAGCLLLLELFGRCVNGDAATGPDQSLRSG